MRLGIIGTQLDGGLKILRCLVAFFQVVQHVAAIHIRGRHFRIQLQGIGEICNRFAQLTGMNVDVSRDQSQVFVARQNWLILLDDLCSFVISVQEEQVVSEIDRRLGIARKFLQDFVPQAPPTRRSAPSR